VAATAEDTIITWTDPELQTDIALSFQEAAGCNHVWEQIQDVHQRGDAGRRRGVCWSQPRPCSGDALAMAATHTAEPDGLSSSQAAASSVKAGDAPMTRTAQVQGFEKRVHKVVCTDISQHATQCSLAASGQYHSCSSLSA